MSYLRDFRLFSFHPRFIQCFLKLNVSLNNDAYGVVSDEAICASGIMRYFGFDCTDEQMAAYISGTGDKVLEEGINSYLSANASDYEMVYASGDDTTYQLIKQELTKGNPVIVWNYESCCSVMFYYKIGGAEETYRYYVPNGGGTYHTKNLIYDQSTSDLIVIRKK